MQHKQKTEELHYLTVSPKDELWGITVTTVGFQFVNPRSEYPLSTHPARYRFIPQRGRILNEYQLVYITRGEGWFCSQSSKMSRIKAGTMILLFPGEWHTYYPDEETGWDEYWVGFKGVNIDRRIEHRFFTPEEPLHRIGVSSGIISLYEEMLSVVVAEKIGYQQMVSSIVLHILGSIYYKEKNSEPTDTAVLEKITRAKQLLKDVERLMSAEQVAAEVGMGYSLFRKTFKAYTGVSPAQYQIQQRVLKAKELLTSTNMNITEIAYALRFECTGQFSTFFKQREGITPKEFRERNH